MSCALYGTSKASFLFFAFAVSASSGRNVLESGSVGELEYGGAFEENGHSQEFENIVQPVSFAYFSADLFNARPGEISPFGINQYYGPQGHFQMRSGKENPLILSDNVRQQSHVAPYGQENRDSPSVSTRIVRFPLNTVLPGNSLSFDQSVYPGLLQAVNTFSEMVVPRVPYEAGLVARNTVPQPTTKEGITTATKTRIRSQGEGNGNPFREFAETAHNTNGKRSSLIERSQQLRIRQHLRDDPEEYSHILPAIGRGSYGSKHEKYDNQTEKEKINENRKHLNGHNYNEVGKEYHEIEKSFIDYERSKKIQERNKLNEQLHEAESERKEKKIGEGRMRRKGQITHGEHNIVKKDEFIKNTKFYDENYGREQDQIDGTKRN